MESETMYGSSLNHVCCAMDLAYQNLDRYSENEPLTEEQWQIMRGCMNQMAEIKKTLQRLLSDRE